METSDARVERAFQEWCALMGVNPLRAAGPGGFRLARDGRGRIHVDQLADGGEARALCPPMTAEQFVAAVQFVHESMNVKTVLVARELSKRRKR